MTRSALPSTPTRGSPPRRASSPLATRERKRRRSSLPRSIYNYAKIYDYMISQATPSSCRVLVGLYLDELRAALGADQVAMRLDVFDELFGKPPGDRGQELGLVGRKVVPRLEEAAQAAGRIQHVVEEDALEHVALVPV